VRYIDICAQVLIAGNKNIFENSLKCAKTSYLSSILKICFN